MRKVFCIIALCLLLATGSTIAGGGKGVGYKGAGIGSSAASGSETLYPDEDVTTTGFDQSGCSGNYYDCIDDSSDSSYVYAADGADDFIHARFKTQNSALGSVTQVTWSCRMRCTSTEACGNEIQFHTVQDGGSGNKYGDLFQPAASWTQYDHVLANNPDDDAAWTAADINATSFGWRMGNLEEGDRYEISDCWLTVE